MAGDAPNTPSVRSGTGTGSGGCCATRTISRAFEIAAARCSAVTGRPTMSTTPSRKASDEASG